MNNYLLVSAVISLLWGVIWSKDNLPNLICKLTFLAVGIWGLVEYLQAVGFVFKR